MKKIFLYIVFVFLLYGSNLIYSSVFKLHVYKIAPNPFIQGNNLLYINTQSDHAYSAVFYLYTVAGEFLFKEVVGPVLPGDQIYEISNSIMLNSISKQLVVLISIFTNESGEKIIMKNYVVVK